MSHSSTPFARSRAMPPPRARRCGGPWVGLCLALAWGSLALGLAAAAAGAAQTRDEHAEPVTYSVRPGTLVFACGGFVGDCHVRHFTGTLTLAPLESGAAIVGSSLGFVTESGSVLPFPREGDLQLTELIGMQHGGQLAFDSPPESRQTVELVLTPVDVSLPGDAPFTRVLEGFYDEGCCDRFHIQFGNVVLIPDSGLTSLDLHAGRFHALVEWEGPGGQAGIGHPIPLDEQSGYFWFSRPDNPEVFVKVLEACDISGRYWIFVGGLTNLGVRVSIFDELVDFAYGVTNPLGRPFQTFIDTRGFPCEVALP